MSYGNFSNEIWESHEYDSTDQFIPDNTSSRLSTYLQNQPGRLVSFSPHQFALYNKKLDEAGLTQTGLVFLPPFVVTQEVAQKRYAWAKAFGEHVVQWYLTWESGKERFRTDMTDPEKTLFFGNRALSTSQVIEHWYQDLQIIQNANGSLSIFVTQDGIFSAKHHMPQMIEVEAWSLSYTEMMSKLTEICREVDPSFKTGTYETQIGNAYSRYTVLKNHYNIPQEEPIYVIEYDWRNSPIRGDLVLKAQALWEETTFPIDPRDVYRDETQRHYMARMYNTNWDHIRTVALKHVMSTMLQSDFNELYQEINHGNNQDYEQIFNFFTDGKCRFIQHPALIAVWSKSSMLEYNKIAWGEYSSLVPCTYTSHQSINIPGRYYQKPLYGNSGIGTTTIVIQPWEEYTVPEGVVVQEEIIPQKFPQEWLLHKANGTIEIQPHPITIEFRVLLDEEGIGRFFVRTAPYRNLVTKIPGNYGPLINEAIHSLRNNDSPENPIFQGATQLAWIAERLYQDIINKSNPLSPLHIKKLEICLTQNRPLTNYGQAMNSLYANNLCKTLYVYQTFCTLFPSSKNRQQDFQSFLAGTHSPSRTPPKWVQEAITYLTYTDDIPSANFEDDPKARLSYIRAYLGHTGNPAEDECIKSWVAPVFILKHT